MGTKYLTELANWLREAGLEVIEWGNWKTKGRSSGGFDGDKPWCVMWHHTASKTTPSNDATYCFDTAPDAPLANMLLVRSGAVYVGAAGATNTNGKGGPLPVSKGTVPKDAMNTYAVSIEAANNGVGEKWPSVQIDSFFTINNTLTEKLDFLPIDLATHQQWAPTRKIDPARADAVLGLWVPESVNASGSWKQNSIREEALRRTVVVPPIPPTPIPEDNMRILILKDAGDAAVLLTGHIGTWLDPARYTAFHNAYPIVDEPAAKSWLANVVFTGPLPTGVAASDVWQHQP